MFFLNIRLEESFYVDTIFEMLVDTMFEMLLLDTFNVCLGPSSGLETITLKKFIEKCTALNYHKPKY